MGTLACFLILQTGAQIMWIGPNWDLSSTIQFSSKYKCTWLASLKLIVEKNLRHTSSQLTFFLCIHDLCPNKIYDWMQMQSSYDAENVSRLVISIYNMTHPSLSLQALPSEIKVQ